VCPARSTEFRRPFRRRHSPVWSVPPSPAAPHQGLEDKKFAARHGNRLAGKAGFAIEHIERENADAQRGGFNRPWTAEYRTQARHQLLDGKGLGQIVVGAPVQSFYPVFQVAACRQHDGGRAGVAGGAGNAKKRQSVTVGQAAIQQQRVIPGQLEGLGAIGKRRDMIDDQVIAPQCRHENGSKLSLIFRQQYAHPVPSPLSMLFQHCVKMTREARPILHGVKTKAHSRRKRNVVPLLDLRFVLPTTRDLSPEGDEGGCADTRFLPWHGRL
jgi:hypothetical protein